MESVVEIGVYVALRLPSDTHKLVQVQPNAVISLGKYGNFASSDIIGRPFHVTYEISDVSSGDGTGRLRMVPAAELYEHIGEEANADGDGEDEEASTPVPDELVRDALRGPMNGVSSDAPTPVSGSAPAKSAFSLAKKNLRKAKRSAKRFTVLPLDVALLAHWSLYDRGGARTMEMREEMLALLMTWSNAHHGGYDDESPESIKSAGDANRWLVVDDTGGLVVAAMAERMGILYKNSDASSDSTAIQPTANGNGAGAEAASTEAAPSPYHSVPPSSDPPLTWLTHPTTEAAETSMSARSNTLTLVHSNSQPNIALLSYFGYDSTNPDPQHPLHSRLHPMSWLQLLDPDSDTAYREPPILSEQELAAFKSSKRGTYHRKRRRWERVKGVVDAARAGGFSGLVIASSMEPAGILRHMVPLLRGGAQVAVYAPYSEPLVELADLYSTARKTAFLKLGDEEKQEVKKNGTEDFPLDPTLLLATTVYTARSRPWQVLPGRTHPVMGDKGGAEGYVFVGTRVLPSTEHVNARGQFMKRRKKNTEGEGVYVLGVDGEGEEDGNIDEDEDEEMDE